MPQEKAPRSWRESVLEFARSCHFDEEHSLHVTKLTVVIFHVLAARFGFTDKDRRLLEAAALLHDVGYFINYSSHHKHSHHLVRHATCSDSPRTSAS